MGTLKPTEESDLVNRITNNPKFKVLKTLTKMTSPKTSLIPYNIKQDRPEMKIKEITNILHYFVKCDWAIYDSSQPIFDSENPFCHITYKGGHLYHSVNNSIQAVRESRNELTQLEDQLNKGSNKKH